MEDDGRELSNEEDMFAEQCAKLFHAEMFGPVAKLMTLWLKQYVEQGFLNVEVVDGEVQAVFSAGEDMQFIHRTPLRNAFDVRDDGDAYERLRATMIAALDQFIEGEKTNGVQQ